MKKNLFISVFCLFAFLLLCFAPVSHAAVDLSKPLNSAKTGLYGEGATVKTLPEQIGGYIKVLLGIVGVMLVIIFIYAGFLWMTSGGNPEDAKKARSWMLNAVIGLLIIISAYAITDYVVGKLAKVSSNTEQQP